MQNSPFSIDLLHSYRENRRLEVKSARGGLPRSLWETYSAFANSEGGTIVLGVKEKEDGSMIIEGVEKTQKLLKDFWNIINNRQKISCNILTDSMVFTDEVDNKNVIIINVPRAERTTRPVYVGTDPRNGTYRRNGEGDYHCTLEEVSLMIRDSALVTNDNELVTTLSEDVFCKDTVIAYRNIFKLVRRNHLWNREDDTMFMRRIGAVREDKTSGKFHPTIAGLLMFGYESDILTVFPNYFLDYQEERTNGMSARWIDRITSQTGDWSGNLFDFILKVIPKLQSDLKVPFVFKGNVRNEDTPLHKTLREATVNMVANADFFGRRGIVINKNIEGFKFANPGGMRVSLNEVLRDSASDPRNSVVMKMLALVEYGERAGSGIQGIFKTWKTVYHSEPLLKVTTVDGLDRTILCLNFEGHTPDMSAMRQMYGELGEIADVPQTAWGVAQYGGDVSQSDAQTVREGAQKYGDVSQSDAQTVREGALKYGGVPQKDAQTAGCVAQGGGYVPQNVPQKVGGVPQRSVNEAQDVPQKGGSVPQNDEDVSIRIVKLIAGNESITRAQMAEMLNRSSKTIGRYLSKQGIRWEGHPKTGHWVVPDNLIIGVV